MIDNLYIIYDAVTLRSSDVLRAKSDEHAKNMFFQTLREQDYKLNQHTPESYSRIPVGDYILYKLGTLEVPDPDVAEFSYPVITPTTLLRSPGCVVANTETYYESVKIVEVKE